MSQSPESGFLNESSEEESSAKESKEKNAAITIQAGYRGMQARSYVKTLRGQENAACTIQAGFRSYVARKEEELNEENELKAIQEEQEHALADVVLQVMDSRPDDNTSFIDGEEDGQTSLETDLSENDDNQDLFRHWKVVETTENGEPLVLEPQNKREIVEMRESSGRAAMVGAIPFELHDQFLSDDPDYVQEKTKKNPCEPGDLSAEETIDLNINRVSSLVKTEEKQPREPEPEQFDPCTEITLYVSEKDAASEMIELFLKEKKVDFVRTLISRKRRHHLALEFLEINPAGTLPTLLFNKNLVKSGAMKIFHFLEEKIPVDVYPMMIPCTTSTHLYQKYLYLSSQIENIDLVALDVGAQIQNAHLISRNLINQDDITEEIDEMLKILGNDEIQLIMIK